MARWLMLSGSSAGSAGRLARKSVTSDAVMMGRISTRVSTGVITWPVRYMGDRV